MYFFFTAACSSSGRFHFTLIRIACRHRFRRRPFLLLLHAPPTSIFLKRKRPHRTTCSHHSSAPSAPANGIVCRLVRHTIQANKWIIYEDTNYKASEIFTNQETGEKSRKKGRGCSHIIRVLLAYLSDWKLLLHHTVTHTPRVDPSAGETRQQKKKMRAVSTPREPEISQGTNFRWLRDADGHLSVTCSRQHQHSFDYYYVFLHHFRMVSMTGSGAVLNECIRIWLNSRQEHKLNGNVGE